MLWYTEVLAVHGPYHKMGAHCLASCNSTWWKYFTSVARLNLHKTILSPKMCLAPEQACCPATWLMAQPSLLPLLLTAPTQRHCCYGDKWLQESQLHTSLFQKDPDLESIKANIQCSKSDITSADSAASGFSLPKAITIFFGWPVRPWCHSEKKHCQVLPAGRLQMPVYGVQICLPNMEWYLLIFGAPQIPPPALPPPEGKVSPAQKLLARRVTPMGPDTVGPRLQQRAMESYTTKKHFVDFPYLVFQFKQE